MARFRWEVPPRFAFVEDVVDAFAEDRGRLAACELDEGRGGARVTFWDLRERSRVLAGAMRAAGVVAGSRVAIALPPGLDWAIAHLATLRLHAVAAAVDPRAPDFAARLTAIDGAAVVADPVRGPTIPEAGAGARISSAGPALGWSDAAAGEVLVPIEEAPSSAAPALLRLVREKTSALRAVVHAGAWIYAQRHVAGFWLDLRRTDLLWIAEDAGDAFAAAIGTFAAWSLGVPVAFAPAERGAEVLRRLPVSVVLAELETCGRLASHGALASDHLRHAAALGGPVGDVDQAWREAVGLPLHTGFGVPECPLLLAHLRGLPVRPGSVGRPFPGHDVHVLGPAGEETGAGETGEIVLRGRPPTLAVGVAAGDAFATGALASRDEQGFVRLVDSETLA